jgi:hypothetical protein
MSPELEFWACHECAASRLTRTICSQHSICSKCNKKSHLGLHCKAQWCPTNRRLEATLGNRAVNSKNAGASTRQNPQSKECFDPLPSPAPDASPSPLRMDLNLAPPAAQSSLPERRQAAPSTSQAHTQGSSALPESMAYQHADLAPFAPFGFHAMEVQHRQIMSRAVVCHQHPTHEDYTIVSIHHLLAHAMHFPAVHEVVLEFIGDHMHVRVRNIQPLLLGQALVRFENAHDRDSLVINGPHPYGDVQFSFVHHNQARNWRLMNFNRECWLMLLGFPLDYWNHESIHSVIGVFGRVLLWENDKNHLARLLVRARVTDLQDVPHFIVFIDA